MQRQSSEPIFNSPAAKREYEQEWWWYVHMYDVYIYRKTSKISRTLVGTKIVDN